MLSIRLFIRVAIIAMVFGITAAQAQPAVFETNASALNAPANAKSVRKANRLLAKSVRQALVKVKGLDSTRIVVVGSSGVVTLNGSVPEASQIGLAVAASRGVSGVTAVNDRLSIKEVGP
jgi:osmotically-inducible protein OsmY